LVRRVRIHEVSWLALGRDVRKFLAIALIVIEAGALSLGLLGCTDSQKSPPSNGGATLGRPNYQELQTFLVNAKNLYQNGADYGLTPSLTGMTAEEFMDIQVVGESQISLSGRTFEYLELDWGVHTIAGYTIDIPRVTIAPGGGGYFSTGRVRKDGAPIGEFIFENRPREWRLNSVTVRKEAVGDLLFLQVYCNAVLEPPHMLGDNGYSLVLVKN